MFTFLYVGDLVNTASVIKAYREALGETTYLADHVIQMYFDEISTLESIMQTQDLSKEFFSQVENNTQKIIK